MGGRGSGSGSNTIYAAGSESEQDLNLMPKGNGSVGIRTTRPWRDCALDVNGDVRVENLFVTGDDVLRADLELGHRGQYGTRDRRRSGTSAGTAGTSTT